VFVVRSQGIFQVLALEPLSSLFEYDYMTIDQQAWNCNISFEQFPQMTDQGWSKNGCFVQRVKDFHEFSAILEVAKEANIPINPLLERHVKKVEPKIVYKILNTYLGWTFYFAFDNGRYFLAGVNFNQF
jgi:hypothetical protein